MTIDRPRCDEATAIPVGHPTGVDAVVVEDLRILVVDDEPSNVELLVRLLTRAGYRQVHSAADGAQALTAIRADPPDLVLLDLLMPGIDGHGVLAEVRRTSSPDEYLPVVVLTADVSDQARRRALEAGATDFLTKPLDLFEVRLRVGNLLQTRALHRRLQEHNRTLRQQVADQLDELLRERQRFIGELVDAQERERIRISGEIHDDTIQTLVAIAVQLEMLRRSAPVESHDVMDRLAGACRASIDGLRDLIFDLHSPLLDEVGLAAALREVLTNEVGDAWSLEVPEPLPLRPELAVQLYRIAQGAIVNAKLHAQCSHLAVRIRPEPGAIVLSVHDDGRGFEPVAPGRIQRQGHIGLSVMRERASMVAGSLEITSHPGQGTTITVTVPEDPAHPGTAEPQGERP